MVHQKSNCPKKAAQFGGTMTQKHRPVSNAIRTMSPRRHSLPLTSHARALPYQMNASEGLITKWTPHPSLVLMPWGLETPYMAMACEVARCECEVPCAPRSAGPPVCHCCPTLGRTSQRAAPVADVLHWCCHSSRSALVDAAQERWPAGSEERETRSGRG